MKKIYLPLFLVLLFLFFGGLGFSNAQRSSDANEFTIYIYIDSLDTKPEISTNSFNKDSISYFIIKKKKAFEDFQYSLQEIVQNKISKVKKQDWQNKEYDYISFYYVPESNLEIRKINNSSLKNLNVIYSTEIEKIQFQSIEEILNKADKIFIIVEKWNNPENKEIKAYQVRLVKSQGGL